VEYRPVVKYRVELEKRLEINKSYKERRNRAIALRILSYGLFGQKRFQNLYLSCSLNCFYWALQIGTFLHRRVAGLAMIIKFDQVHVIEYYEQGYAEKKYTKILIKLTKNPTPEDKAEPGYNPCFKSEDIKDELTEYFISKVVSLGKGVMKQEGEIGEATEEAPEEIEEMIGDRKVEITNAEIETTDETEMSEEEKEMSVLLAGTTETSALLAGKKDRNARLAERTEMSVLLAEKRDVMEMIETREESTETKMVKTIEYRPKQRRKKSEI
jgi:hypothetical protein